MKYIAFIFILFFAIAAHGAIIFQDDFDTTSWPDDYDFEDGSDTNCPYCDSLEWYDTQGGSSGVYDSVTHWEGEVTTPGREGESDRSFKMWRGGNNALDAELGGSKLSYRDSNLYGTSDLYMRFYMKIPTDFQLASGTCYMNYLKLARHSIGGSVGAHAGSVYINFNGGSFSTSDFEVTGTQSGSWITLVPMSEIQDGAWHCHEIRVKLSGVGASDGIVQYWLDGSLEVTETGLDYDIQTGESFTRAGLGTGNTGARVCEPNGEYQTAWRAIDFDDYVLSTTYIGLAGEVEDTDPPVTSAWDPAKSETDVEKDTNIVFVISDTGDGVDVDTIVIGVEGTPYDCDDAVVTCSGTSAAYTVTYNQVADYSYDQVVNVTIDADDLADTPNSMDQDVYLFTIESEPTGPVTSDWDPAKSATGVDKDTNIVFVISDDGDGVDIDTIQMDEEGNNHCWESLVAACPDAGDKDLVITGTSASYTVTYDPGVDYSYDQVVNVTIDADDLAGTPNSMEQDVYLFTIESEVLSNDNTIIGTGEGETVQISSTGGIVQLY